MKPIFLAIGAVLSIFSLPMQARVSTKSYAAGVEVLESPVIILDVPTFLAYDAVINGEHHG